MICLFIYYHHYPRARPTQSARRGDRGDVGGRLIGKDFRINITIRPESGGVSYCLHIFCNFLVKNFWEKIAVKKNKKNRHLGSAFSLQVFFLCDLLLLERGFFFTDYTSFSISDDHKDDTVMPNFFSFPKNVDCATSTVAPR